MARPRENNLPPYTVKQGKWFLFRKRGEPSIKLIGSDAQPNQVWDAYNKALKGMQEEQSAQDLYAGSMHELFDQYFESKQFRQLGDRTKEDYKGWSKKILSVFGKMSPDDITPPHVQRYMDKRGEKHPTAANHDLSLISIVFNWGIPRGYVSVANPCSAIKKIKVTTCARYVSDAEYDAFYNFLMIQAPMVIYALEIAYLCQARRQDVLDARREDIREQGLFIEQNKTGKKQIKKWSPRLKSVVENALAITHKNDTDYIIRNKFGKPYKGSGFSTAFKRLRAKAIEEGVIEKSFRIHDLKHKGVSDTAPLLRRFASGHTTEKMADHYNQNVDVVPTIGSED